MSALVELCLILASPPRLAEIYNTTATVTRTISYRDDTQGLVEAP